MKNIVLFGAPGAGKGTQAEKLVAKFGFLHISTGEVLRNEIAKESAIGLEAKKYMAGGGLAPDAIVIEIIANFVASNKEVKGVIFDGFPRTTNQAVEFDKVMTSKGLSVSAMLELDVKEEELIKRLLNRGKDSGRADDASEDIIKNRIKVYKEQTAVVADFYSNAKKHHLVDGSGTVDEIFARLAKIIETL